MLVAAGDKKIGPRIVDPDHPLYLRVLLLERGPQGYTGIIIHVGATVIVVAVIQQVQPIYIRMEPVMADLMLYPETDEDGAAQTYRQSRNIDKRIQLVLSQTAQGKTKIDPEHRLPGFNLNAPKPRPNP